MLWITGPKIWQYLCENRRCVVSVERWSRLSVLDWLLLFHLGGTGMCSLSDTSILVIELSQLHALVARTANAFLLGFSCWRLARFCQ